MSGEKLMGAIGNISDRYIMEFSNVTPRKYFPQVKKMLPYAACLLLVISFLCVCPSLIGNWTTDKPIDDNSDTNITSNEGVDSADAPIHFYLNGKTFIADPSMTIVTDVPNGYQYVGTVKNVGDAFSGKDFEGNMSGAVYLSKDGTSAYVEASSLEKVNGKNALVLCVIEE